MPLWAIVERKSAQEVLDAAPIQVRKKNEVWKNVVSVSGPVGLQAIRGFRDEALHGKLDGYRSSRLNDQYRVIYSASAKELTIYVKRVSPHDYRTKQ
jgi:Txe/YoeB family toxin of Txe-Axe toxin-antitoxin module